MQLSYNIFKGNIVEQKKVVSPPSFDKITSTVIKSNNDVNIEEIIDKIKKDAIAESEQIINEAKRKAQEILKNSQEASRQITEDAKNKGYDIGYKQGYDIGINEGINISINESKTIIENANNYFIEKKQEISDYVDKAKEDIIDLSIQIAKEILRSELSINQELIVKLAEQVITKSKEKKNIVIKCAIEDYKIFKKRQEDLALYLESSNDILIIVDPELKSGDIVLESSTGLIDATMETRLQQICNKILKE